MKLWRFSDPSDYRFARAGRVGGTWQDGEYEQRRLPLIIEWEPDSDVVGDFTWPGLDTDIVVTDSVVRALVKAGVGGFEFRPVEMQENSERSKRRSKKPRVKLPYSGPPLWDFWVTQWTAVDHSRSTVTRVEREDGSQRFDVFGIQRIENEWDQQKMELVTVVHPRLEGEGIFVPPIRGIFRVEELPAWVFCTDDVKSLIDKHGFTNVSFLEMGDVSNDG